MTQTTTPTQTSANTASLHPVDILTNLIVTLLAPMFLTAAGGDIAFARMAAAQTVNAYRIRNDADLIAVAQIIAFGLAALGSVCLSMADDISPSMTLRLRGNAVALDCSVERNRRALRDSVGDRTIRRRATTTAEPEPPLPPAELEPPPPIADDQPAPLLTAAAAQQLTAEAEGRLLDAERPAAHRSIPPPATPASPKPPMTPQQKRQQAMWAIAMVKEASELTASIANLPPGERKMTSIRAAALSSTAHDLLTGAAWPPPTHRGQAASVPPKNV